LGILFLTNIGHISFVLLTLLGLCKTLKHKKFTMTTKKNQIKTNEYYSNYHGHMVADLYMIYKMSKRNGYDRIIWLAGDSSLDNKYWILNLPKEPATRGYEQILEPPECVPDVCYHVNRLMDQDPKFSGTVCINTSVEATTLAQRKDHLLFQDKLIRDHVTQNDTLVVSIGGNDVVLKPSVATIASMLWLSKMSTLENVRNGTALGMGHLISMFRDDLENYIGRLTLLNKPKTIMVCMVYYPDKVPTGGWADWTLKKLGYDKNPEKVQAIIQAVFKHAIQSVSLHGTQVVHIPLFEVLDGSVSRDYVQRVEPSSQGGAKMASTFLQKM
jgi:hypothetical protein